MPGAADPANSGVTASLLRVTVSILRGDVPYTITALIEPKFETGGTEATRNAPGRRDEAIVRTGTQEEQQALNYPFAILQLSEFSAPDPATSTAARYSVIDIDRD